MMHRGLPFGNTEARLWRRMTIFASVAGAAAVWAWGCAGPEAKNAPTGDEAVNSRELSGPALMDSTPVVVPASTSAFSHGPYYAGVPRSTKAKSQFKVLDKGVYTVGYSESRREPLWAAYRLFKVDNPRTFPRPTRFKTDQDTDAKISHDDYTNSHFDRGHLCPSYAMATRYGKEGQVATFVMSNICPQKGPFNKGAWQAFEWVESVKFANDFEEVWVLTGPIFSSKPLKLSSDVHVPKSFFKIVVDEVNSRPTMLAIVMTQEEETGETIEEVAVTVDDVERRTGLDFFSELPDDVERRVESAEPDEHWMIDLVLDTHQFPGGGPD